MTGRQGIRRPGKKGGNSQRRWIITRGSLCRERLWKGAPNPRGSPCHPPLSAFPRQRYHAEHRATQHPGCSTVSPTFYHAAIPRQPMKVFRMGWRGRYKGASWDTPKGAGRLPFATSFRYSRRFTTFTLGGLPRPSIQWIPAQSRMEALMQPPEEPSALLRAVVGLQAEISSLRTDLTTEIIEIKRLVDGLSTLMEVSNNIRYYQSMVQSQEQSGGQIQRGGTAVYGRDMDLGTDKDDPPLVLQGTVLQCVRCGHRWIPRTIRPQQCAKCRAPWWFPPKWRWHKTEG